MMSVKKLGIAVAAILLSAGVAGGSSAADILDQVLPLDTAGLGSVQTGLGQSDGAAQIPDGDAMFQDVNDRMQAGRDKLIAGLATASAAIAADGGNEKAEAFIAVMPIVYDAIGPAAVGAMQQGADGLSQGVGATMGALGGALNLNPGQAGGTGF